MSKRERCPVCRYDGACAGCMSLSAEVERLRRAVCFARSVIRSGEAWSNQCESILVVNPKPEEDDGGPWR